MKTLVCLIRHGETNWNKLKLIQGRTNIPLNENGIQQLHEAGKKLVNLNINWDVYLSSPLDRALKSCEIIKFVLNDVYKPIEIRQNLIEREFGIANGTTINQNVYERILIDDIEGIEKTRDIQIRAINELQDILKKYKGKNILIVTHSHFIKALFTVLDSTITFKSVLKNGGLNFIEFNDEKIKSYYFNK